MQLADTEMYVSEVNEMYNLKIAQAIFNRAEFDGLTQGEISSLAEYAAFIKSRRKE